MADLDTRVEHRISVRSATSSPRICWRPSTQSRAGLPGSRLQNADTLNGARHGAGADHDRHAQACAADGLHRL